ncbi:MAG: methyltransferase domain-containing protein [Rhizobiales bacterium]|nr:methyltransferase domain-containing protein [Hyphomicrobiales bacterium]MBI3672740.1 methyltransferase domain-containing protein [Hyphomicrobiales bacterium]
MQYRKDFTDALQFVWGEGFLSPGGPEEIAEMLRGHDLAGKRVLDVGSGLGGVDLLLAGRHGAAEVIGVDVEEPLVAAARELAARRGLADRVKFRLVEPGPLPFEAASFDVVFTKDAMVHIDDKPAMYKEVLRMLKPGGAFIASDWLWGKDAAASPVVKAWLEGGPLHFAFTTTDEAEKALRAAGFDRVAVVDRRQLVLDLCRAEIETLEGPARQRLAAIVGEEMATSRLKGTRGRLGALQSGDLIPSHLKGWKRR